MSWALVMKNMFITLFKVFQLTMFFLFYYFIKSKKNIVKRESLLLLRLDSIGDYILFRNFIEVIKNDVTYHKYKITLCGNKIWQELAESFDKNLVDEFIWIDRAKFYKNLIYKYKTLKFIYSKGFEIALASEYSHEIIFTDSLIKMSNATQRIGISSLPDQRPIWLRKWFSHYFYTSLIAAEDKTLFEFYQNKRIFELFLNHKINLTKPKLDISHNVDKKKTNKDYLAIIPGASQVYKRWPLGKFSLLVKYLLDNYSFDILILGSYAEKKIGADLISEFDSPRLYDFTGKTTLTELVKMVADSILVVSNDTGSIHIAAAVDTKFVCITDGNRRGRFYPYPAEIFKGGSYVYPKEFRNYNKLKRNTGYCINNINLEEVTNVVKNILPSRRK